MNAGVAIARTIRRNLAVGWLGVLAFFGCALAGTAAVLAYFYFFGQPVPVGRPSLLAAKAGVFAGVTAAAFLGSLHRYFRHRLIRP